jgi:hypothetical protein
MRWNGVELHLEIIVQMLELDFHAKAHRSMGDRGFDLLIYVFAPSWWRCVLASDVELTLL